MTEKHNWTAAERAKIKSLVPGGMPAIRQAFPDFSYNQLYQRFYKAGGRMGRKGKFRPPGRIPIPERAHPLVRELIGHANRQKTYLGEIAERAGFCPQTFSRWRWVNLPRIDLLIAALNVLDLELRIVPRREAKQ